ncbi:MAG: amidohydrolase family protein [Bacteroidetes bacterium]|nr:amidohydrolase family protein [Bacteroidota bacterium]
MIRKFTADNIFDGNKFTGAGHSIVCTSEGEILAIENNCDNAEKYNGIIIPGFINCHCHLELSNLKSQIKTGTGLVTFVQEVMKNRIACGEELMYHTAQAMKDEGIVAVGDICNTSDTANFKNNYPGILWRNFVEVSGFVDAGAEKRFNAAIEVARHFQNAYLTPHSPYSVSDKLFELISKENNNYISIHNQESEEEDSFHVHKTGKFLELYKNLGIDISKFEKSNQSSIHRWLPHFKKAKSVISVHNTFTSIEDIEFALAYKNLSFCICIKANIYIENKIPPIDSLRDSGCKIVLGTDSLASNNTLSILSEIKEIKKHFPAVPIEEILQWATKNGAEALGFETLGSFSGGKKPGIYLLQNAKDDFIPEECKILKLI